MQRRAYPNQRPAVVFSGLVLVLGLLAGAGQTRADQPLGIQVPDGFTVTRYADDDRAHDIHSMTIDTLGRVVVSGPGYVRILLDKDNDGRAESYQQFADGPKTGAQGLYFQGRNLLFSGDNGLMVYRDANADDRADGPADLFLRMKAGGEHHAHAIQKGPDGWWYVIAGNFADINAAYVTLPTSPVKTPISGALLRLKPDLSGGEIFCDGYRNAYDFAFDWRGGIFAFDSDGEREVSLPWYRPTRVFHSPAASNAGWITESCKRADDYFDMAEVVEQFGRGSPTGVLSYRHEAFPPAYRDALFILDWTFGRVMALQLTRSDNRWSSKTIEFMKGIGQSGFAPTDVEAGPDGSLFVSVGGRGTRGAVYRVKYTGPTAIDGNASPKQPTAAVDVRLAQCLDAPQPLSSWSRVRWQPVARELGRTAFVDAALNEGLSAHRRIRAIEILVEMFDGVEDGTLWRLGGAKDADVRARAAWSIGRTDPVVARPGVRRGYLQDADPTVRTAALESLCGLSGPVDLNQFDQLLPYLAKSLGSANREERRQAARVVGRLTPEVFDRLHYLTREKGVRAQIAFMLGRLDRGHSLDMPALELGAIVLEGNHPLELKRDAIRLMQKGLGDVGPTEGTAEVFDGYVPLGDLSRQERELDVYRARLAKLYPTGTQALDWELARLLGMLAPYNRKLLDRVLAQITAESNPVDDIHHLIVGARIPIERDAGQREATAKALVAIESKIRARHLNQDSSWNERIGELYKELCRYDPPLPEVLVKQPQFGLPGHVLFMSQVPAEALGDAIAAFVRRISSDAEYHWTTDVVFVIGESKDAAHRRMVREQYGNLAVQSAVLLVLAGEPESQDRAKFVAGLESSQREVLSACLEALGKLPAAADPREQCALVRSLRRLSSDAADFPLRAQAAKLLERNNGQTFGFVYGKEGYGPQQASLEKWTQWATEKYPAEARTLLGGAETELADLKKQLAQVDWQAGDAARGSMLFEKQSCARCHGGHSALGPDLNGVTNRFSRNDVFTAIVLPNRDVSPRYQTTLIQTSKGDTQTGLVIYEAVDGMILRNSTNQTVRINPADIEARRVLSTSLMPSGLLKDLKPGDLADLYAYLATLNSATPHTARSADTGSPAR